MLKKLDNIIEYFKTELELLNQEYSKNVEGRRFTFNTSILMFSGFIVLVAALVQVFLSLEWMLIFPQFGNYIQIMIFSLIVTLLYSIFHHIYFDWKDYKHYFSKKISLEIVLRFLQHLKLVEFQEEDLNGLVKRIKFDFRDYRKGYILNKKEYKNFELQRLDEYLQVIDKINYQIIEREKKN
ncbi:MAG: hypothetical protein Q8N99_00250 [Nanoarchaeota archaeon]|nr:hypothetical protein [Nanoarchaeota archaeon]